MSTTEMTSDKSGYGILIGEDVYGKEALIDSVKSAFITRVGSSPPASIMGGTLALPTGSKIPERPFNIIQSAEDIRRKCLETLLICLPRGYGFIPVLDPLWIGAELAFGKLGCDKLVHVLMSCNPDIEFTILGTSRRFHGDEIRFLVLDILDRIHELNGIDDEQDPKGSD